MAEQMDKQGMESEVPNKDFEARRRLLKASAAAPLIATLTPDAALAMTSLTCAQKGLTGDLQTVSPVLVNDGEGPFTPDAAVRHSGLCYQPKGNGKPTIYNVNTLYYNANANRLATQDEIAALGNGNSYDVYNCEFVEYFMVNDDTGGVHYYPDGMGIYPFKTSGDVVAGTCISSIGVEGVVGLN